MLAQYFPNENKAKKVQIIIHVICISHVISITHVKSITVNLK